MADERRDPPTLLTPQEWRVLLRHAATAPMGTDEIRAWLEGDDHPTEIDAATDAALRARLGRPPTSCRPES